MLSEEDRKFWAIFGLSDEELLNDLSQEYSTEEEFESRVMRKLKNRDFSIEEIDFTEPLDEVPETKI